MDGGRGRHLPRQRRVGQQQQAPAGLHGPHLQDRARRDRHGSGVVRGPAAPQAHRNGTPDHAGGRHDATAGRHLPGDAEPGDAGGAGRRAGAGRLRPAGGRPEGAAAALVRAAGGGAGTTAASTRLRLPPGWHGAGPGRGPGGGRRLPAPPGGHDAGAHRPHPERGGADYHPGPRVGADGGAGPADERPERCDPHVLRRGDRAGLLARHRGRGHIPEGRGPAARPGPQHVWRVYGPEAPGSGLYLCGKCGSDVCVAYRGSGVRIYVCRAQKHLTRLADPIDALVNGVVEARLAQPDLAGLLAADDPEVAELTDAAAACRARIRRIEADYGAGEITARVMREQSEKQRAALTVVERRLAELTRASRLSAVVGSADPVAAWLALDVPARQAVVRALMDVILLRGRPGRAAFDPDTVLIEWRGAVEGTWKA